jgi:AcrR family transcriptional regulator
MTETSLVSAGPGRAISQERSRKTYDALIAAGFRLLEESEFESITIAMLAQEAGYSVGAFYARFESKDEFFEAMVAHHLRERARSRQSLLATASRDSLASLFVEDLVKYYWQHRRFWRAALLRSTNDPEFWAPINQAAVDFVAMLTDRIGEHAGHPLTESERANIRFAIHMVLGMVNNRIVNRPRPSLIGHSTFVENLTRAFGLVADLDRLFSNEAASGA